MQQRIGTIVKGRVNMQIQIGQPLHSININVPTRLLGAEHATLFLPDPAMSSLTEPNKQTDKY